MRGGFKVVITSLSGSTSSHGLPQFPVLDESPPVPPTRSKKSQSREGTPSKKASPPIYDTATVVELDAEERLGQLIKRKEKGKSFFFKGMTLKKSFG